MGEPKKSKVKKASAGVNDTDTCPTCSRFAPFPDVLPRELWVRWSLLRENPREGAYWLADALEEASQAKPDDEQANLAARLARALAAVLRSPETDTRALRKAVHALQPSQQDGLGHADTLPAVDRYERRQRLLADAQAALRIASRGFAGSTRGDTSAAAEILCRAVRRALPSKNTTPEVQAGVAQWLARYIKRDAPTPRGAAEHALVAHGMPRDRAKDFLRA